MAPRPQPISTNSDGAGQAIARLRRVGRRSLTAAWRAAVRFYTSDNFTHASSISFYGLMSLFPCLLLFISLLGRVTADEANRATVLSLVLRYFPAQLGFVDSQLDAFRQTRLEIRAVGLISLTWAALGVFSAISSAVNHAWGVERQRSYLSHKLVSFLMMLAAGGTLLIALVLVSAVHVAEASWFAEVLRRFPVLMVLQNAAVRNAPALLLIAVLGLVYYFIPNTKVRFADVWLGAIIAGVLWRGATGVLSWSVSDMSRMRVVHGSIAAVIVFLLWVYVSAVIVLYGAEFTAAFGRLRREESLAADGC